jgi:hypothetical protein
MGGVHGAGARLRGGNRGRRAPERLRLRALHRRSGLPPRGGEDRLPGASDLQRRHPAAGHAHARPGGERAVLHAVLCPGPGRGFRRRSPRPAAAGRPVRGRALDRGHAARDRGRPGVGGLRCLWADRAGRARRRGRVRSPQWPPHLRGPLPCRGGGPEQRSSASLGDGGRAGADQPAPGGEPGDPLPDPRPDRADRRALSVRQPVPADAQDHGPCGRHADRSGREPVPEPGRGPAARGSRSHRQLPAGGRPSRPPSRHAGGAGRGEAAGRPARSRTRGCPTVPGRDRAGGRGDGAEAGDVAAQRGQGAAGHRSPRARVGGGGLTRHVQHSRWPVANHPI